MSETPDPSRRNSRSHAAILEATIKLLGSSGYVDFSIEKVVVNDLTNNPMGSIDIQNRMQISIENDITSRQFNKQDNLQYSLIVNIRQYEEGSAFLRWVIPGMGETFLNIETMIYQMI